MKVYISSLFILLLLSGCATTAVNGNDASQVVSSTDQGAPPGSTLKCNCAATFAAADFYFP